MVDGERLDDDTTPAMAGLEDNDIIEAAIQQTGGQ
jgi:hypothetical protein